MKKKYDIIVFSPEEGLEGENVPMDDLISATLCSVLGWDYTRGFNSARIINLKGSYIVKTVDDLETAYIIYQTLETYGLPSSIKEHPYES